MPLLKNRPKIDLWYQYLSNSYKPNRLKLETILFSSSHPKTKKQKKNPESLIPFAASHP